MIGLIAALFLGMLICPNSAKAANTVSSFNELKNGFKATVTYSKTDRKEGHYFILKGLDSADEADVTKVAVKNKKLGTAKPERRGFRFYPKKTGKTTVTAYVLKDGKKVKFTGTITVKKFKQPFNKLTIGGKSYRNKIAGGRPYINITSVKKKTIQYKLNSGWKVTKMYDDENKKIKTKTKFTVDYGTVTLCMKHRDGTEVVVVFSNWYES